MNNADVIKQFVDDRYSQFGNNRKNRIARLLYEIAKREKEDFQGIITDYGEDTRNFDSLQKYLLRRRFPSFERDHINPSLTALDINPAYRVKIQRNEIQLKNVYIEKDVQETEVVRRLKQNFPDAHFEIISSYRDHWNKKKYSIDDYNHRTESFYFIKEKYDFFKRCPCSSKSVPCQYHIVNLGSGCAYECRYCFLQDYINSPGIVIPANLETFFEEFKKYKQDIRIGSGELTDSLIFDHITEYSPRIVEFFKDYPNSTFEFKTKSNKIDKLLTVKPAGNIVVSWSVNPQHIVETIEHYTASLEERLEAAEQCIRGGYLVAFHFDPIMYYQGWEEDYRALVDMILDRIPQRSIYLISLGTLRMTPRLKKIIENRFPDTDFLDEEFTIGHDGKMRYPNRIRQEIYTKMKTWIHQRSPSVYLYLCMEEKEICSNCETAPLKQFGSPQHCY